MDTTQLNSGVTIDPPESTRYACGLTFGELKQRALEGRFDVRSYLIGMCAMLAANCFEQGKWGGFIIWNGQILILAWSLWREWRLYRPAPQR